MEKNDLKIRAYSFSLNTYKYLKTLKYDILSNVIVKQLMRSSSSVSANLIEARNSSSRLEFKRYYEIALKSCNESTYWFCLLKDGQDIKDDKLPLLLRESTELSKILAKAVISLKSNNAKVKPEK
jgi:four helix bundle protein